MKTEWLDRRIAHPGPHLALCLSEAEYLAAMKRCKVKHPPPWITTPQANATTHFLSIPGSADVCVVCLRDAKDRDPISVAGLLVHEAVHVWQDYAESIGETNPGREQEAYAIQAISQELMAEYARRITNG